MHILSNGSKGKALWKEFEMHLFYMKLGAMAYLWRLIEDCPLLQATS